MDIEIQVVFVIVSYPVVCYNMGDKICSKKTGGQIHARGGFIVAGVKTENELEQLLIEHLAETTRWQYVKITNYKAMVQNFREQFCKLNADNLIKAKGVAELSDKEFERVMNHIDGKDIYQSAIILRDKFPLLLDDNQTIFASLLTSDTDRNIYQMSHQIRMEKDPTLKVKRNNRYDVTLLINGLPLIQIELKNYGVEMNEAINQINRYRRDSFRGLFHYIQIFVVSNGASTKYFANANEYYTDGSRQNILKSLAFFWTDANNERINRLIDFANDFFPTHNITELLTKYFIIKKTEPVLMVLRPYQIHAVKQAYDRIIIASTNGYVFHTTGSGKTVTSYRLASLLRTNPNIAKVFFLIDRKDLDAQTVSEYNSFEPGCVDETENTKELIKAMQDSSKPMIVTTIQKMATALRSDKYNTILEPYRDKRCVFIIDECHRSQFGKMHGSIQAHFKKANYVGFTGTPIFAENKGPNGQTTATVFDTGNSLNPCIHQYMIKEAIADGNVLRFSVEFMRLRVQQEIIAELEAKGIDVEMLEDVDYCRKHKINRDSFYHLPKRIAGIADDVLAHLEQHIHPEGKDVYTALFAIDRIPILMEYYRYLKSHNPKNYKIAAIFTYAPNDDADEGTDEHSADYLKECIDDYNRMFETHYDIDTFDAYRNDISNRMKQKDLPQIDLLLVVDMFLTGFDSKPTNTLILDKNLKWHGLLQAYSRTNRIFKPTKQFGQIVTYRNIKRAQDEALKLYSGGGTPNDFLMETYEYYCHAYGSYVVELRKIVPTGDDAGYLIDEEEQAKFVRAFRKVASALAIAKTFSKFDWADMEAAGLGEEEFLIYKSWYLEFYDQNRRKRRTGEPSPLEDIDFSIELIRTDKINVRYILNLLKNVNRDNPEEMRKAVDLILRELERTDNAKLRYKREIMRQFIEEHFFKLKPDVDIFEAYRNFEEKMKEKEIADFVKTHKVDSKIIHEILNHFVTQNESITKNEIREKLKGMHLGLMDMTRLISAIQNFCKEMFDRYTTEVDE